MAATHRKPEPLVGRLIRWSEPAKNGCRLWTGRVTKLGYGRITVSPGRVARSAHIVSYETFVGPIPSGLQIDHECHNRDLNCAGGNSCVHRRCIEPSHLAAKTPGENTRAGRNGNRSKTHCKEGHPLSGDNVYMRHDRPGPGRQCKACRARRMRNFDQRHPERKHRKR